MTRQELLAKIEALRAARRISGPSHFITALLREYGRQYLAAR